MTTDITIAELIEALPDIIAEGIREANLVNPAVQHDLVTKSTGTVIDVAADGFSAVVQLDEDDPGDYTTVQLATGVSVGDRVLVLMGSAGGAIAFGNGAPDHGVGGGGSFVTSDYGYSGYSTRFAEAFATVSLQQTLDQILSLGAPPYVSPAVTLNTPASVVAEQGSAAVTSVALSATTVEHSSPITSVTFWRQNTGGGATNIHTQASPNPTGGTEAFTAGGITQVPDAAGLGTPWSASYHVEVGDGASTTSSNVRSFTYAYPTHWGVGAAGLVNTAIAALSTAAPGGLRTGLPTGSYSYTTTANRMYLAYPKAYGPMSRAVDPLTNFDYFGLFTQRFVTITGLDGTAQDYYVYEYSIDTTVTITLVWS